MATTVWLIYLQFIVIYAGYPTEYTDKLIVKFQENHLEIVEKCMAQLQYVFVDKIIDGLYVFEKSDGIAGELLDEQLQKIKDHCDGKIEDIEQSRYMFPLVPIKANDEDDGNAHHNYLIEDCHFLYHETHGISQAWSSGYSGKGVVIGMINVGFPVLLPDSLPINISLSHDFGGYAGGSHIAKMLSNETSIAKIPIETCNFCDVGVAYNAEFVDLEIGAMFNKTHSSVSDDDMFARALVYKQLQIDIYACEWKFSFHLNPIDIAIQSSILSGVKKGRGGLGSIYVLPSGHAGDGFFNDTFVISVGSVVSNQTHHSDLIINSATLVSAIITDGYKARKGSSLCFGPNMATGMIAGMIALIIQANHILSIRDIKQILIQSSTHLGLDFSNEFRPNGAGNYFHPSLGFGYPNASQMIEFAKSWKRLPMQYNYRYKMDNKHEASFHSFMVSGKKYVHKIEEVVVQIKRITFWKRFTLFLISPNGTLSFLYESPIIPTDHWSRTPVSRWFMSTHFWGENSHGIWKLHCLGCSFMSAVLVIQGLEQSDKDISSRETSSPKNDSISFVVILIPSVIIYISIIIVLLICFRIRQSKYSFLSVRPRSSLT
ncbi:neuroendocrine convertase 2-like [Mya arenaria]|uniref:neuroendocrine convertase 2-like n=1 Tax=Mya arenaria TaxID=6604 RepID=UPI0022E48723|nr:neuroendocrine convertase 2-like [Mya arenaria]